MPEPPPLHELPPTDAELRILHVLWELGPATVRAVHTEMHRRKDIGYTSVLKLLQVMHEKGLVRRDESNRAHVYTANVSKRDTQKGFIESLVDKAFEGSASKLVLRALAERQTSPEELAEIRELINKLEEEDNR